MCYQNSTERAALPWWQNLILIFDDFVFHVVVDDDDDYVREDKMRVYEISWKSLWIMGTLTRIRSRPTHLPIHCSRVAVQ